MKKNGHQFWVRVTNLGDYSANDLLENFSQIAWLRLTTSKQISHGTLVDCLTKTGKKRMLSLNGLDVEGKTIKLGPVNPKMSGDEIFGFICNRLKVLEEVKGRLVGEKEKSPMPLSKESQKDFGDNARREPPSHKGEYFGESRKML